MSHTWKVSIMILWRTLLKGRPDTAVVSTLPQWPSRVKCTLWRGQQIFLLHRALQGLPRSSLCFLRVYLPTGKLVKPVTLGKVIHDLGLNFYIFELRELDLLSSQAPSERQYWEHTSFEIDKCRFHSCLCYLVAKWSWANQLAASVFLSVNWIKDLLH